MNTNGRIKMFSITYHYTSNNTRIIETMTIAVIWWEVKGYRENNTWF